MKTPWLLIVLMLGLSWTSSRAAEAAPDTRIRVLILDGYSNHDWRLTTALIKGILEPTGLFTVTVSTAPPSKDAPGWDAWRPSFSNFDVIIQTCNDLNGGPPWPREVRRPSKRSSATAAASTCGTAATTPSSTGPPTTR